MPTYQATFTSEKMTSCRNFYASTIWECIYKVIDAERGDWVGEVESVKLVQVEIVRW